MTVKTQRCLIVCLLLLAAFSPASGAEQVYKVRRGDNLSRIAKRFHVKPGSIIKANGLSSDLLMPGDRLTIPGVRPKVKASAPRAAGGDESPPKTRYHKVERGETLTSIARLHGMSVKELKSLNHIRRPRKLKAGARILVRKPEAEEPAAVTAAPAAVAPETRLVGDPGAPAESPAVNDAKELSGVTGGAGGLSGIKEKLVNAAREMLDIPYRRGGSSFMGIDCSGYVQKVFGMLNIMLPRTAREQFNLGTLVGLDNLSIGDLVFFRTYADYPSHVGIYLGDNRFIHASSKDRKVKIDSLDAPYYIKRFVGARRLPLDEPAGEI